MMGTCAAILLISFGLTGPAVQDDAAAKKAEAKAKIAEFKEAYKASKSEREQAKAFRILRKVRHPLVFKELKGRLTKGKGGSRKAAANILAGYRYDKAAAEALLKAVGSQKEPKLKRSMISAYARTGCWEVVKPLIKYFDDPDTRLAQTAIGAAGSVKSTTFIDPLIRQAQRQEKVRYAPTKGDQYHEEKDNPAWLRRKALLPAALNALQTITGQKFDTAGKYAAWWSKNKKDFKIDR